jgi:hypothetical protein
LRLLSEFHPVNQSVAKNLKAERRGEKYRLTGEFNTLENLARLPWIFFIYAGANRPALKYKQVRFSFQNIYTQAFIRRLKTERRA